MSSYTIEHSGDWFLDLFDGLIFDNSVFGKKRENLCNQTIARTSTTTSTTTTTTSDSLHNPNTDDFLDHDLTDDFLLDTG